VSASEAAALAARKGAASAPAIIVNRSAPRRETPPVFSIISDPFHAARDQGDVRARSSEEGAIAVVNDMLTMDAEQSMR